VFFFGYRPMQLMRSVRKYVWWCCSLSARWCCKVLLVVRNLRMGEKEVETSAEHFPAGRVSLDRGGLVHVPSRVVSLPRPNEY